MKKLHFVKSKLKDWNKVHFGDFKERKKNILSNIVRIDISEQEWNLTPELSRLRALKKGELKELLLKEEDHRNCNLHWNMNFHLNLKDLEIENLERLMFSLTLVHLSPFVLDTRAWSISSLGLFLIFFFFCFFRLVQFISYNSFLSNQICMESKVLSKVKAFA